MAHMGDEDLDYYDENDELYEDDEIEDDNGFIIRDRLKAPTAMQYTTRELHTLIHEGVIDLSPPYQRDIVWPEAKQIRLLDSIYRNYYVPPIVFARVIEDGSAVLRCVDGKQRLTSIQRFFDGQIPYKDPYTKKSYWYVVPELAKNKLEVPQFWKNDFSGKKMTCIQYEDLESGLERDIFQRVQLGIPLSQAEKLQAIASPWSDWISELDRRMLSSDTGISNKIDIDLARGRNFQLLAHLVCCCERIPSRSTHIAFEEFLTRSDGPSNAFKREIDELLTTYWHFADKENLNMAFRKIAKRVAPVEFIFIGVLLYVTRGCDERERAIAAFDMRKALRTKFKDVRNNGDLQKFCWDFIAGRADSLEAGVFIEEASSAPTKRVRKTKRSAPETDDAAYGTSKSGSSTAKRPRGRPRKNPA